MRSVAASADLLACAKALPERRSNSIFLLFPPGRSLHIFGNANVATVGSRSREIPSA